MTDLFGGLEPSFDNRPKEQPVEDTRTHVRLARKDQGDDVSFSRYVVVRGSAPREPKKFTPKMPGLENDAQREGRTYFGKSVKQPGNMTNLLVSGHSNVKIGRDVRVGKFKGWWLYTLSLEERKTCPTACNHWQNCYGNGMPYAKRIDHTAPNFLPLLEANLERLTEIKNRPGIIVRLHALGDFYSPAYVGFWGMMLVRFPNLVIFGYTAWLKDTPIGAAVQELIDLFPDRAMIRYSNGDYDVGATVPIINAEDCPPGAFVCPEQTGQFDACGKCGACWSTLKNVAFMAH